MLQTEKSNDIISMVFLTEESENAAPAFARLLRRARQRFPSKLNSVALRINRVCVFPEYIQTLSVCLSYW